jgi:hypothetical protein
MTVNPAPEMNAEQRCVVLAAALDKYRDKACAAYDEVVNEVIDHAEADSNLGKGDLGALLLWKRIRVGAWATKLLCTAESRVREVTGEAVTEARRLTVLVPEAAANARAILARLDGMKNMPAFASAVIYAAAPKRMAVYDYRAHLGLWKVGLPLEEGSGLYCRYMTLVEQCRQKQLEHRGEHWTARDVDLALYQYAEPPRPRIYPWRKRP